MKSDAAKDKISPKSATILHIDDSDISRKAVAVVLRLASYEVLEAATGKEGLQLAASLPDLILLDINLPDLNGFEVCRQLKNNPVTASIPVIHFSASFFGNDKLADSGDSGADGFLSKTVTHQELLAHIQVMLRLRRAEETVRLAARQWQSTVDALSEGICLLDETGVIARCNQAFADLLGKPYQTLPTQPYEQVMKESFPGLNGRSMPDWDSFKQPHLAAVTAAGRPYKIIMTPTCTEAGTLASVIVVLKEDQTR